MLGRRQQRPDRIDARLPRSIRRDDAFLDARPPDGPVSFAATRVGGSTRRGNLTAGIAVSALAALVAIGIAGPPSARPLLVEAPLSPDPASGVATAAASGTPVAAPSLLVLTSPSHDEALVVGHLAVVGYVRGESRNVSLLLGDGARVVGSWQLLSAAKAGDPSVHARAWFETRFGLEMLPLGRSLWVEVGVMRDDGAIDSIRRSFRLGPIIEPDEE